jgi:hypothetical protein
LRIHGLGIIETACVKQIPGLQDLEHIIIEGSLAEIGPRAFADQSKLVSVVSAAKLVAVGESAFGHCTTLQSVSFASGLEEIGSSAFEFCGNLVTLQLPDSVKVIARRGFYRCSQLRLDKLPASLEIIGHQAFGLCPKTVDVSIGPYLSEFNGVWWSDSLQSVSVDVHNPSFRGDLEGGSDFAGVLFTQDESTIALWPPQKPFPLGQLLPANVTKIGLGAFYSTDLSNAQEMTFLQITHISTYSFACSFGLRFFDLSLSAEVPDNAFRLCEVLVTVILSRELIRIGHYAFSQCTRIQNHAIVSDKRV